MVPKDSCQSRFSVVRPHITSRKLLGIAELKRLTLQSSGLGLDRRSVCDRRFARFQHFLEDLAVDETQGIA